MIKPRLASIAFFLALSTAAFAAPPELVGKFDDWAVYKTSGADGIVCYALAQPKASQPTNVRRDPIFFLISTWPGKSVQGEPSIVPGYPYREESRATVEIGSDKFEFYTQNEGTDGGAWMKEPTEEQRLLDAMRRGSSMVIKGTSRRGTLTIDNYSLKGATAALDRLAQGCQ